MSDNSGLIVAALLATAPELAGDIDAQGAWKSSLTQEGARVALYRKYEEGEHRSGITDQMKAMLRISDDASGINDFNDNYCEIIVEKMAGRLHVNEISLKDDSDDENWLAPILERNGWEALQGSVYRAAIRDGNGYVMVDPLTLKWTSEAAYDGFDGLVTIFDKGGLTPLWACKLWSASADEADGYASMMELEVYQPNTLSYWKGAEGEDTVTAMLSAPVPEGELPTNFEEWKLGLVPILRFMNKQNNYATTGRSELRPAIPLQDTLNRTLHSMVMASEFSAFMVKWAIGMPIDASKVTPGAVINLFLKDASGSVAIDPETAAFLKSVSVGEFGTTDLNQYIIQINSIAREASHVTQTPIYGVTTEGQVSGEALQQLEIGLIGKCIRFQRDNSDTVRALIRLTAEMQKVFDTEIEGSPPIVDSITIKWQSPELLDSNATISMLIVMRKDAPGLWDDDFYRQRIGELMGLSSDDIQTESDKSVQSQSNAFLTLTGGAGNIPVV